MALKCKKIRFVGRTKMSAAARRWMKQQTTRRARRIGLIKLEDAPVRLTVGWYD